MLRIKELARRLRSTEGVEVSRRNVFPAHTAQKDLGELSNEIIEKRFRRAGDLFDLGLINDLPALQEFLELGAETHGREVKRYHSFHPYYAEIRRHAEDWQKAKNGGIEAKIEFCMGGAEAVRETSESHEVYGGEASWRRKIRTWEETAEMLRKIE